ncbi:MAG: nitronate monooxygenase [Sporichthyaceae bacterium]
MFDVRTLAKPIVQAPLAGGASTPALAAAVSSAGGLGFLAAGYKTVDALAADLADLRSRTAAPFGVNLFANPGHGAGEGEVAAYAARLAAEGATLGEPRWDDDGYAAKLDLLCTDPVPVVSVTFAAPSTGDVARLHAVDTAVWVTVTTVDEAKAAVAVGADALVLQGVEAGGHRGTFDDSAPGDVGLLALLQTVSAAVALPLVATGGIATGAGIAAALASGASAAQLGTAFMRCPEAGTAPVHRAALGGTAPTAVTRAFTGRSARGIRNRFLDEHADAPSAYPQVHHLTAPMRAAARTAGDADALHLWAGQAYPLTRDMPAGVLVSLLDTRARAVLRDAAARWQASP